MITSEELANVDLELRPLLLRGDTGQVSNAIEGWVSSGLTTRVVRGRKMRCLPSLFDELAAALQFPLYFGENEDAFEECLSEPSAQLVDMGLVLVITDPGDVLLQERPSAALWFGRALATAAKEWATPVDSGEWWDRPAVPFHVILAGDHVEKEDVLRFWTPLGSGPM